MGKIGILQKEKRFTIGITEIFSLVIFVDEKIGTGLETMIESR